ncbi:MAG: hypothetical protein M1820_008177 [Bogoriella megaspora]|nr:MAG: hypothetical protein M1820_008177 [Bogoriella megaspora]
MSRHTNQYIREVLHHTEPPPPINARFFYTSPLAIDDPLSPLPPLLTGSSAVQRHAPRPFSTYDNTALDKAWNELRRNILKYHDERGEKPLYERDDAEGASDQASTPVPQGRKALDLPGIQENRRSTKAKLALGNGKDSDSDTESEEPRRHLEGSSVAESSSLPNEGRRETPFSPGAVSGGPNIEISNTTGTPFIRAPSRSRMSDTISNPYARPSMLDTDSYDWQDDTDDSRVSRDPSTDRRVRGAESLSLLAKIPVGVSRLHEVIMPQLRMEPIYWPPLQDVSDVIRGTWFYKESMLPVEVEIANMLEAGYAALKPWTETWNDELNSAVEVGALGEMKILHSLWPEPIKKKHDSRPGTATGGIGGLPSSLSENTPEKQRERMLEEAESLIDISTGIDAPDNKAGGKASYGRDGQTRMYSSAGVIYANEREAYILNPKLQPSNYYGRRPLANYIRKGHKIGILVVRGFDQDTWDKLHPSKKGAAMQKAEIGVSTSQAGAQPKSRQRSDPTIARAERPKVTDLVLVIHGIGQKLSERVESYNFTYAMNALRREMNVELGTASVKSHLRKDLGGVMLLPVNWRSKLSFEDGGYRDGSEEATSNQYTLKDITPDTLPSVRGIVSDVMLDIPYYLSHHQPKMIAAVIHEANRIYRLWCTNNPGFQQYGKVHLIAHSLGSVMAVDILSSQPTYVEPSDLQLSDSQTLDHFVFDTKSLFIAGSPAGFFLLLKKASLLPRRHRNKPGADPISISSTNVTGERGEYGCLAVDNIFNIINPYDPVAYKVNAALDADYAAALRPAWIPSASTSWNLFGLFGGSSHPSGRQLTGGGAMHQPVRLPSSVELETHNFTREELAEKRALLLNDNGQIDFFLRYGGGAFEIQYLTMLGAHSSYWISKDFVRFVVVEIGREEGRDGTLPGLRAQKKKAAIGG